jgi:Phage integrase family
MLKIKKRGKKGIFWLVGACPITGERIRRSLATNSEQHAEAQRVKLEGRLLDEATYGKRLTATFAEAVILYCQKGHSDRFLGLLVKHFGMRQMATITDVDVANFASLHYPNASPPTLNRQVYTPMIAVWRGAHVAKLCGPHEFRRPKQREAETVSFATDYDIASLLAFANVETKAAILLLTYTGGRASEICRITGSDVDWEAQTVLLRKTKNGKPRVVPLTPMTLEALLPLRQTQGPICGFNDRWRLNDALETACEASGLEIMTTHQIGRHAFAARLLRQGKTLKELQEAGGWSPSSLPMLARVYGHLERKSVDAAVRGSDTTLAQVMRKSLEIKA